MYDPATAQELLPDPSGAMSNSSVAPMVAATWARHSLVGNVPNRMCLHRKTPSGDHGCQRPGRVPVAANSGASDCGSALLTPST